MKKKKNSKIKTFKILEILSRERSVDSAVDKVPGLSEDDVWNAVSEAALVMKESPGKTCENGVYGLSIDGSAVPNPGDAGIGIVIRDPSGRDVRRISKYIGHASNNIAEYTALIEGMREVLKLTGSVEVRSDSELLVRQLNGQYRVKNEKLQEKILIVRNLEEKFDKICYNHVLREYNSEADKLANTAARKKK